MPFKTLLRIGFIILLIPLFILNLLADTILDDFQVNVEPPGHPPQDNPYSVANWNSETIYTTWLSFRDTVNWDAALQLFDYDLQTIGDVQYLNIREGTYNCQQPRLAISSNGVGAAWIEERNPNRILFRSLDAMGNPISSPMRVEDNYEDLTRNSLNIAALEDGYILIWYDARDTSAIRAQIVDFDGNLIGGNFPVRPDSTGGILGLECQNHPDGRVLVSWVTDQQYSRGRWLDADGSFMGDVFDMADPFPNDEVISSLIRFETGGSGILYQYSDQMITQWDDYKYSYITYLNSQGLQVGERVQANWWYNYWYESPSYCGRTIYSFPDLVFLADSNYVSIRWHQYTDFGTGELPLYYDYNIIYSSINSINIIPWGLVNPGDYNLCHLNENEFLYCFDLEYGGLRKYEITTLDSTQQITWIYEPNFGMSQGQSEICVHQDGTFRVIYNNRPGSDSQVYSRYFNAEGTASAPDTIVSMNISLDPVYTSGGKMKKTSEDHTLVIWQHDEDVLGTTFDGSTWSGQIDNFGCGDFVYGSFPPTLDINNSDNVILFWQKKWLDYWWGGYSYQGYCQSFSQIFNFFTPHFIATRLYYYGDYIQNGTIALREYGRFIICWRVWNTIYIQIGYNYQELIGDQILIDSYVNSAPALEKSPNGYWLTWIKSDSVHLQQFDSDGNLVGDANVISSVDALATGDPDLAVSETGNFIVVWKDARDDEGDIYCRKFNPDGSFFGEEFKVNSDPPGVLQCEPAVAFGQDDQLYFTWTDHRNQGGQGDIYCKVITWDDSLVPPEPPEPPPPLPYVFELKPPAPNPFNTGTKIGYSIPQSGYVSLTVHNLLGQEVAVLVNRMSIEGNYELTFNGADLASGVYILRLQAGNQITHQKLVLLR